MGWKILNPLQFHDVSDLELHHFLFAGAGISLQLITVKIDRHPKTLLLLDRGFYHFQFFSDLIARQVHFILHSAVWRAWK
jgi:hypothetical protein